MRILVFLFVLMLIISCNKKEQEDQKPYTIASVQLADGVLHRIDSFPSNYVKPRPVDVWLPSNYSKEKKYAVLYMHDGQMLFDASTTWNKQEWKVDETLDSLSKAGTIKETIVVAIWNIAALRNSNYFPEKVYGKLSQKDRDSLTAVGKRGGWINTINSDNYLKFIVEEVKPYVDANYSTLSDAENTSIMGSSRGGLISLYAICEYPEVFGAAACLSTHWIGTYSNIDNQIPEVFMEYLSNSLPNPLENKIYFDYGTETLDALYLPYQDSITEIIKEKGYQFNIEFEGHDHSEISWSKRLYMPLEYLLIDK